MTIILRSDKAATRNIGNIFGIQGPTDYSAVLDFSIGVYKRLDSGVMVNMDLADAVTSDRSTAGMYKDDGGQWLTVGATVPRIHNGPEGRGLLIEPGRRNFIANPFSPATQTVTIPATSDLLCLSVIGPGSATMSGALTNPESASATEGAPMYAGGQAGSVTVTVTGSLQHLQLELIPTSSGTTAPTTPVPAGIETRAAETIRLATALNSLFASGNATIAVSVMDRLDRRVPYRGQNGTVALQNTTVPQGGIYSRRSNSSSSVTVTGQVVPASTTSAAKNASPVPGFNISNTTVITYSGHGASIGVCHNGIWAESNAAGVAPAPNDIRIGGGMQFPAANAAMNSILQRVVIYPRKLTQSEAVALSTSWL